MADRITLDLSGTEDATKGGGGDFSPLPKGWYEGVVYEASLERTKQTAKNPNKPFYKLRLNVTQEGEHYRRVVFDNVMLFTTENAPWMAQKGEQLARITEVWDGEDRTKVEFPTPEELEGTEVEFYVTVKRDDYREKELEKKGEWDGEPIYRNEVSAYRPVGGWPKDDGGGLTGGKKTAAKKGSRKITL